MALQLGIVDLSPAPAQLPRRRGPTFAQLLGPVAVLVSGFAQRLLQAFQPGFAVFEGV